MAGPVDGAAKSGAFELALLSDLGTDRPENEDSCGHFCDDQGGVVFAIADGIGGYEGGEVASQMAIEATLEAYRESPPSWGPAKRLVRAVQRANIEIHNRALAVPELRRMGTTLTAVAVENARLNAAHVGDCRLYLVRHGRVRQLTKDHTVVGEWARMGLITADSARLHPERSVLNRSLGRELIVSVDRITMPLERGDELILCSDGLYTVIGERELGSLIRGLDPTNACVKLVEIANARGTADNLSVAVFRNFQDSPEPASHTLWERLARLFGRNR